MSIRLSIPSLITAYRMAEEHTIASLRQKKFLSDQHRKHLIPYLLKYNHLTRATLAKKLNEDGVRTIKGEMWSGKSLGTYSSRVIADHPELEAALKRPAGRQRAEAYAYPVAEERV